MTARSFSKEIRQNNIKHAISVFGGKKALIAEIHNYESMYYGSTYHAIYNMVKHGCFLIYYDEQREYIRKLLKETKQEAAKYSDDKVFNLYCHLLARDVSHMPELKE